MLAALAGNTVLTVIKFAAFAFSGSGAMLSESIHSLADSFNQGLLFLGISRSQRPPDRMFHYGYGVERYLFSLLSAVGIFVLGCGVTVYHGIHLLLHPHELSVDWVTFAVLGVSLLVEGSVLLQAMRAVAASKGDQGFLEHIRESSDPTVLAVLFEDGAACLGVLVAAAGIGLSQATGDPMFDAIASITIGLMMGAIAVWLGYRNRQLILGPAIPAAMEDAVARYIESQESVHSVHGIKSRVVAADRFRLKAEIDYNGRFLAEQHQEWFADRLADVERGDVDAATLAAEFGEKMLDSLGREVDRIEAGIVRRFPQLRYLDLESHWVPDGPAEGELGGS